MSKRESAPGKFMASADSDWRMSFHVRFSSCKYGSKCSGVSLHGFIRAEGKPHGCFSWSSAVDNDDISFLFNFLLIYIIAIQLNSTM